VGELGWELHVPSEAAPAVVERLHTVGIAAGCNGSTGLVMAGYRALLNSLRLEKRFVHFGHDVSPTDSPIEAGLG
jgi:4-methylaminobutanoate oxidase (formaldehyde-forming)